MKLIFINNSTYKCSECKNSAYHVLSFNQDLIQIPICKECIANLLSVGLQIIK